MLHVSRSRYIYVHCAFNEGSSPNDSLQAVDKYIPVNIDGEPIQWFGNPAYLDGALYEASLFYKRRGLLSNHSSWTAPLVCPTASSP